MSNQDSPGASTEQASKTVVKKKITVKPITDSTWAEIQTQVDAILATRPDLNIGVSVIDSKTGAQKDYGDQDAYHGASTTKVLTAAAFLHLVEEGQYSLTTSLSGVAAQEHLRLMLNQSDNNSWAVLNAAVGHAELTAYAQANGINSYNYVGNLMTPSDQALLLQKVYTDKVVNDEHTKLMLGYMQDTNNEDMIPVVAPTGSTLYHKYGQLDDRLHDSAIIDYKKRPVIIVIYTKGEGNTFGSIYASRIQLVQDITSAIITPFYTN